MGEPEIVVRAQHDALLALDDDDRVFGLRDRLEVGVESSGLQFPGGGKAPALVEQCHLGLLGREGFTRHGSSRSSGGSSSVGRPTYLHMLSRPIAEAKTIPPAEPTQAEMPPRPWGTGPGRPCPPGRSCRISVRFSAPRPNIRGQKSVNSRFAASTSPSTGAGDSGLAGSCRRGSALAPGRAFARLNTGGPGGLAVRGELLHPGPADCLPRCQSAVRRRRLPGALLLADSDDSPLEREVVLRHAVPRQHRARRRSVRLDSCRFRGDLLPGRLQWRRSARPLSGARPVADGRPPARRARLGVTRTRRRHGLEPIRQRRTRRTAQLRR